MKIRTKDTVKVITGKDVGKTGKVIQVFPKERKVVVEGVNKLTKHMRPRNKGEKGQRIEFSAPLPVSNVQLVCPSCSKQTRVAKKQIEGGKHVRVCKKCKQTISL